ncbi:hypothetical protein U1Q18_022297 [Sarracenia purpurea var. burkii]
MINREESLIIIIINAKNSVGHPIDVIGVVIVAGQGHDPTESRYVDRRRMTLEVGPEIAHDNVAFEDGSKGLELVARRVLGGFLELRDDGIICHHLARLGPTQKRRSWFGRYNGALLSTRKMVEFLILRKPNPHLPRRTRS